MATGIARITHTPSSVLRHHYADLHKVISQSRETRISLANRFFQTRLIDFHVLSSITDSDGCAGAQTLLGHLSMKVEQSSDYLPGVIDILGCEVSLIDIVERMNVFRRDVSPDPIDVTITGEQSYLLHVIGGGISSSNANQERISRVNMYKKYLIIIIFETEIYVYTIVELNSSNCCLDYTWIITLFRRCFFCLF